MIKKKCKPEEFLNPETNRCISKTGRTYKILMKKLPQNAAVPPQAQQGVHVQGVPVQGVPIRGIPVQGVPAQGVPIRGVPVQGVPIRGVPIRQVPPQAQPQVPPQAAPQVPPQVQSPKQSKPGKSEDCPDGKAYNTRTKRCINIGTTLYRKAVKEGWIKEKAVVPRMVANKKCKNTHTFVMFDDIQKVPETDFIKLPNGYCFSSEELIDYIKDSGFDNKNPHDKSIDLFTTKDIEEINNKELKKVVKAYFDKKNTEHNDVIDVLYKNLHTLHIIAFAGRVCYFNQISSREAQTSAPFENSINALNILMTEIEKLNDHDQKVFLSLYDTSPITTLKKSIVDANNGAVCIHGVGVNLIFVFIKYFMLLEQKYKVVYDNTFTGLYFVNKNKQILFMSSSNWFTPDPNTNYYKGLFGKVNWNMKSNLIMGIKDIAKKGKSEIFENTCINDSFLATIDSADNWKDIPEWQKIKHEDNSCFDIFFLIKIMISNLNESKNNNPYPQFPNNPFTRKIFLPSDFLSLKRLIQDNYITIAPSLQIFLDSPELWENVPNWSNKLMTKFERTLRFKRLNTIIDVNDVNITGFWVLKTDPVSRNEGLILRYLNDFDATVLPVLKRAEKDVIPADKYFKIDYSFSGMIKID